MNTDGYAFSSADGLDWQPRPKIQDLVIRDMVWTGDDYVAVSSSRIWSSPDGESWSAVFPPGGAQLRAITSNGHTSTAAFRPRLQPERGCWPPVRPAARRRQVPFDLFMIGRDEAGETAVPMIVLLTVSQCRWAGAWD